MKNAIISFFVSRLGSILTPIIAGIVGVGVVKIAATFPDIANAIDQKAVVSFIVLAIIGLINYLTNAQSTDGIKSIQALVNTKQDGVLGPGTYTEVRKAIAVTPDAE
jgi:H+/Cl- antiporter ClcA